MGKADFSNPKSVTLLTDLVVYATRADENAIILDFFSGSSTTAHAVMKAEYSGRFYTPIPEIGNHRSDMKETAIPF